MLKGKTAVVTGGYQGIGMEIAKKLGENGADIAVLDIGGTEKAGELLDSLSGRGVTARAYSCDISDFGKTQEVFAEIVRDFGHIDILVNNAGITRDKLLLGMKEADFDSVISVNLKGVFNAIKQVYPLFAKQKSGKIVNLSSVSGLMGNAGQVNYSASKAGIVGLTKSVAKELASRGVCCNAIAPGFIKTAMTTRFAEDEKLLDSLPMKRMGEAEEVAELVLFLCSDKSNYITGEVIRIDGGLAM
ncbi:MAG: 3-oxoacyl-[acyl-carrier-protein] reductase [Clostridiales bacterium]|nr:3-oxoacyl-[acyl-carrier-protein] reductase [Clostridiales bacterium]